jgi:hypothetical protein
MNIYLSGACRTGKAEIARRLAGEVEGVVPCLDPSEGIFRPVFGHGLDRIFRGRLWEGRMDQAYDATMRYLEVLGGTPGQTTVFNEGPLPLLAHLTYFGGLALATDHQREAILAACLDLLGQGEHYVIQRWANDGTFDRVNVALQTACGCNRANVFLLPPARDYAGTVEAALSQIRRGSLAMEEDVLARIADEREAAQARTVAEIETMERLHADFLERERAAYEQLEAERARLDEELTRRREETERMVAAELAAMQAQREEVNNGADDNDELQPEETRRG